MFPWSRLIGNWLHINKQEKFSWKSRNDILLKTVTHHLMTPGFVLRVGVPITWLYLCLSATLSIDLLLTHPKIRPSFWFIHGQVHFCSLQWLGGQGQSQILGSACQLARALSLAVVSLTHWLNCELSQGQQDEDQSLSTMDSTHCEENCLSLKLFANFTLEVFIRIECIQHLKSHLMLWLDWRYWKSFSFLCTFLPRIPNYLDPATFSHRLNFI